MQLSPSFSLLCTSLLLALNFSFTGSNIADAKPLDFGKIITMPMKRHVRTDVHPSIALEQSINHGLSPVAHTDGSPHVSRAEEAKSLHLTNYGRDISYQATIQIGTPPRDFFILIDSGSSDFWVESEVCKLEGGGSCGYRLTLGQQSSSSFTGSQLGFEIRYGSSLSVLGTIVHDDISIAGLTLKGHTFGVVNVQTKALFKDPQVPVDGLMGLGPSTNSFQGMPTPVEALAKAGLIDAPIVSYKLSRGKDQQDDGEITFGGLDTTKFDPKTLVTVDNLTSSWWVALLERITIGSLTVPGGSAILDTGTTLAFFPPKIAKAIHAQIPGAAVNEHGLYTLPCDTSAVLSLTFGGGTFDINPKDLSFTPLSNGMCVSAITPDSQNRLLLGATFLKNVYFSTNIVKNTISLAKLV